MYTIIMSDNKELITTCKTMLYQRENMMDKIQFLIPQTYADTDLSDFTAILKYTDQSNVVHAELLTMDEELYKGKLRYTIPVDTDITKYAGDIELHLTFTKTDIESKIQYVLHTGDTTVTINPRKDLYAFVPDESLEYVDQIVGQLDAKIEAVEKMAETYDQKKADNITYDENKIQLTSNGQKIGDAITIIGGDIPDPGGNTEFEVVEF